MKLETNYLPAECDDPATVDIELLQVATDDLVHKILKCDTMTLILNEHRQIIFANEPFMTFIGFVSLASVLGKGICRVFRCEHVDLNEGRPDTYEACRSCHIAQAFFQFSQTGDSQDGLFLMSGKHFIVGGAPVKLSLKPTVVDGVNYFVVTLDLENKREVPVATRPFSMMDHPMAG